MSTITSYNTTNALPNLALSAPVDGPNAIGQYSMAQILVEGLNNLAEFNANFALEVNTGFYNTGVSQDGAFYITTNNYTVFFMAA